MHSFFGLLFPLFLYLSLSLLLPSILGSDCSPSAPSLISPSPARGLTNEICVFFVWLAGGPGLNNIEVFSLCSFVYSFPSFSPLSAPFSLLPAEFGFCFSPPMLVLRIVLFSSVLLKKLARSCERLRAICGMFREMER